MMLPDDFDLSQQCDPERLYADLREIIVAMRAHFASQALIMNVTYLELKAQFDEIAEDLGKPDSEVMEQEVLRWNARLN